MESKGGRESVSTIQKKKKKRKEEEEKPLIIISEELKYHTYLARL